MGANVCCPCFLVLDCGDDPNHKHIACRGSLDNSPVIDNSLAKRNCLSDFRSCPLRPKGENGGTGSIGRYGKRKI